MIVKSGATGITTYVVLRDSSTHAPKTDVVVTDVDLYYVRTREAMSAKADATALASAAAAHTPNGAYHVGHGLYRIDWPDAAFAGAAYTRTYLIVVCAGCDTEFLECELSPYVTAGVVAVNEQARTEMFGGSTVSNYDDWDSSSAAHQVVSAVWNELQSSHTVAGSFGKYLDASISSVKATGSGAAEVTLILRDVSSNPVADADVWVTSDSAGANVVAGTSRTNSSGAVTFYLDRGVTYYRWAQKDGVNFSNPQSFEVP